MPVAWLIAVALVAPAQAGEWPPQYREPSPLTENYNSRPETALPPAQTAQRAAAPTTLEFTGAPASLEVQPANFIAPAEASSPAGAALAAHTEAGSPLKLSPPTEAITRNAKPRGVPSTGQSLVTVGGSLLVVLGLFLGVVWLSRKTLPKGATALPSDAVQVLGRTTLGQRHEMHLVRIGGKLLLVASTPSGASTLTEVTDREEIQRLTTACEGTRSNSATSSFRDALAQLGNEPTTGGFFGRLGKGTSTTTPAPATRTRGEVGRA